VQSSENVNIDLSNVAVGSILGATLIYADPGVWGYAPPSKRSAVVVGIESSKVYGYYLIVKPDGINIPKHIKPEQVVQYVWATEPEGQAAS